MKQILLVLMLVLFSLSACDISTGPGGDPPPESGALQKQIVDAGNAFGLELFREIAQDAADENIFISPLSVAMALGMTLNGAGNETYEAMKNTLGFGDMTQEEINLTYQEPTNQTIGFGGRWRYCWDVYSPVSRWSRCPGTSG